jgi:hypothetical protein
MTAPPLVRGAGPFTTRPGDQAIFYQIRLNRYRNNGHTEERSRTEGTENFIVR